MTPPLPAGHLQSPSLDLPGAAAPAYELKFLLDETRAQAAEAWARQHLAPDPHGDPALGGAYRTTSLYFDTPELDVFHRAPSYRRRKYRVRRYGAGPWAFLERKSKWGDRVAKRRSLVPEADVALLAHPMSVVAWPGHWFHRRLLARRLTPACRVAYQRLAFVGAGAGGALRLTIDRHVHGALTGAWDLAPVEGGLPLLHGQAILEFKFRAALPAPFKALARELRLSPGGVSKYRLCRETWGVIGARSETVPQRGREAVDA